MEYTKLKVLVNNGDWLIFTNKDIEHKNNTINDLMKRAINYCEINEFIIYDLECCN